MLLSLPANMPDLSTATGQLSRSMSLILNTLQAVDPSIGSLSNVVEQFQSKYSIGITGLYFIISLIGCFFGYKLSRVFMAISGFIAGSILGFVLTVKFLDASNGIILLGALVGGILCSMLAYKIYQAGIFVLCFFLSFIAAANLIPVTGNMQFFLCTVIGFIVATLALKYVRTIIIVTTSLVGAHFASQSLLTIGPMTQVAFFQQTYASQISFAVLFILGCLVQFLTNKNVNKR